MKGSDFCGLSEGVGMRVMINGSLLEVGIHIRLVYQQRYYHDTTTLGAVLDSQLRFNYITRG